MTRIPIGSHLSSISCLGIAGTLSRQAIGAFLGILGIAFHPRTAPSSESDSCGALLEASVYEVGVPLEVSYAQT